MRRSCTTAMTRAATPEAATSAGIRRSDTARAGSAAAPTPGLRGRRLWLDFRRRERLRRWLLLLHDLRQLRLGTLGREVGDAAGRLSLHDTPCWDPDKVARRARPDNWLSGWDA